MFFGEPPTVFFVCIIKAREIFVYACRHDSEKQLFLVIVLMCVFVETPPTPTSTHRRNESHKISAEIFLAAFQQKIQKIFSGNWKILTMTEPTKNVFRIERCDISTID